MVGPRWILALFYLKLLSTVDSPTSWANLFNSRNRLCIFKSIISLQMLLKQLSEPLCSIQHQSKYWHNSENGICPFVEWESGHCSQRPVVSQLVILIFIGIIKPSPAPRAHHLCWKCRIRKLGKVTLGNSNYRGSAGLACLPRCAARHVCCLAEMLCSQKRIFQFSKCLLFL